MDDSDATTSPGDTIDVLDESHRNAFCRALSNLLSIDVAEQTYAQILDGLPTEDSLLDGTPYVEGHPVYELCHTQICDGYLDKARMIRAAYNPSDLKFDAFVSAIAMVSNYRALTLKPASQVLSKDLHALSGV